MKHKNLLILSIAFFLCIAAAVLGLVLKEQAPASTVLSPTLAPMPAEAENAALYLIVTVGDLVYQPFPIVQNGEYTILQENGDSNVIKVNNGSISMLSSTCHNQDCVKQGIVSLQNRELRPLGNKIICLPHKLTLALYTASELPNLLTLN
ncbi:MAG: NusG domain II-containing protein [Clostridia bacterium]